MGLKPRVGDEVFEGIFRQYAPAVYYYSLRLTNSPDDAQEVVQETFMKVWENRSLLDSGQNIGTYINTIARNHIYDMFRRTLVRQKYGERLRESLHRHVSLEQELHLKELREVVARSVERLQGQQREILVMKSKGFLNDEIAQLLGLSKRTVESHLNKAYKTMREDLGNIGDILPLSLLLLLISAL